MSPFSLRLLWAALLAGGAARAVRSQYAMLAVMIGFTTPALWLLSQANA